MKYHNTGVTDLVLPTGRRVRPGQAFNDSDVPEAQLQAWRAAGSAKAAPTKKKRDDPLKDGD